MQKSRDEWWFYGGLLGFETFDDLSILWSSERVDHHGQWFTVCSTNREDLPFRDTLLRMIRYDY
jgi:hypothetical protein